MLTRIVRQQQVRSRAANVNEGSRDPCGDRSASALIRRPGRRAAAACRTVLARAHTRRGDEPARATALLQAEADLARSRPGEEPTWIGYFGEADLADENAHCFFDLGLHELAQREATRAVELLEPHRIRRLAIDTAPHATSLCATSPHATSLARSRQSAKVVASPMGAIIARRPPRRGRRRHTGRDDAPIPDARDLHRRHRLGYGQRAVG